MVVQILLLLLAVIKSSMAAMAAIELRLEQVMILYSVRMIMITSPHQRVMIAIMAEAVMITLNTLARTQQLIYLITLTMLN